jgi:hypothetical protein
MLIYAVVGLPLDYYSTFVLEERHGFNKSTKKLWVVDQIKTWILFVVLGFPIIAAFLRIIDWAGKSFVPWLMLFLYVPSAICASLPRKTTDGQGRRPARVADHLPLVQYVPPPLPSSILTSTDIAFTNHQSNRSSTNSPLCPRANCVSESKTWRESSSSR